jgi:hypothetical protein
MEENPYEAPQEPGKLVESRISRRFIFNGLVGVLGFGTFATCLAMCLVSVHSDGRIASAIGTVVSGLLLLGLIYTVLRLPRGE